MRLSNNQLAGISGATAPRAHDPHRDLLQSPPRSLLTDELNAALGEYAAAVQRQNALDRERAELFTDGATADAFRLDQEAAADAGAGADVATTHLDTLDADRRRALVGIGGAALACDRAVDRVWAIRTDGALNAAATKAADQARADVGKLLDKLTPLLTVIATHRAAGAWMRGEPYAPSRFDSHDYVAAIAAEVTE